MAARPFILQRPPLLTLDQLGRIEEAAIRILADVGIEVRDPELPAALAESGFRATDGRFRVDAAAVRAFIDEERARGGEEFGPAPPALENLDSEISFSVNTYAQNVHDLDTDRIVPFTTDRLVEATKLLDALAERGVTATPPGCPTDVPGQLQPVVQYWIAATHSRQGRRPADVRTPEHCPFIVDMAEALGNPINGLPVYVNSPLLLAGDSLRCVLEFADRLGSVYLTSMPSLGNAAPINVGDAFALAAAETIGSAMLVRAATGLPVYWHVGLYATDFASLAMVFGSPETVLLHLMMAEVNAWFRGTRWSALALPALTMAKLPGPQSCAEKSSVMTLAALLGQRWFDGAGSLSLDEVFSAEQLLYDLEMRDHAARLARGMSADIDVERCLREVGEGVQAGSFVGLDSTLDSFRALLWQPRLFDRSFLGTWRAKGERSIRQEARAEVARLLRTHDYGLPLEEQRAIDAILARAREQLT